MIGVNSVQSTSKVRVRATGSVKYSREESLWRQSHRSKSMKISNSSEFSTKESKVNNQVFIVFLLDRSEGGGVEKVMLCRN